MLNPVLFALLEKYLAKTETLEEQTLEEAIEEEKQIPVDICNHALLVGYGRVGSLLGEKLLASDIPLVVIETSRTVLMSCESVGSALYWAMQRTKKLCNWRIWNVQNG